MTMPVIRIRSSWHIIYDACNHFGRNLGYFFLLSILPLGILSLGCAWSITYLNAPPSVLLFGALPVVIFFYSITLLISWETFWGVRPIISGILLYALRTGLKFGFILILFWVALIVLPLIVLFFIQRVVRLIIGSRKEGATITLFLAIVLIACVPLLIALFVIFQDIDPILMLIALILTMTILSIPGLLLVFTPTLALFNRCNAIKAFTESISLAWGYWLHILPFILIEILSIFAIAILSAALSGIITVNLPLTIDQLTLIIGGTIYMITLPFFINLRVFYFQDLTLRQQGYNALLRTRDWCNNLMRPYKPFAGVRNEISTPKKNIFA